MTKDRNALKAGTFIVVATVLSLAITISIKDFGRFAEAEQVRTVHFKLSDNLGGLRVGDEVRVGGFKVGNIQSIEPLDFGGAGSRHGRPASPSPPGTSSARARSSALSSLTGSSVLNVLSMGKGNPADPAAPLAGVSDPRPSALASLGDTQFKEAVESFKKTADTATDTIAQAKAKIDPPTRSTPRSPTAPAKP